MLEALSAQAIVDNFLIPAKSWEYPNSVFWCLTVQRIHESLEKNDCLAQAILADPQFCRELFKFIAGYAIEILPGVKLSQHEYLVAERELSNLKQKISKQQESHTEFKFREDDVCSQELTTFIKEAKAKLPPAFFETVPGEALKLVFDAVEAQLQPRSSTTMMLQV